MYLFPWFDNVSKNYLPRLGSDVDTSLAQDGATKCHVNVIEDWRVQYDKVNVRRVPCWFMLVLVDGICQGATGACQSDHVKWNVCHIGACYCLPIASHTTASSGCVSRI